jgi:hypothetical protein
MAKTHGSLRRRDRGRLVAQGIAARLERRPSRWRARLFGTSGPLTPARPPDSALARAAEARPGSRAALLNRLGFAALIDHDPLDRTEGSRSRD